VDVEGFKETGGLRSRIDRITWGGRGAAKSVICSERQSDLLTAPGGISSDTRLKPSL